MTLGVAATANGNVDQSKSMWKPGRNGNRWQQQCMAGAKVSTLDQTVFQPTTDFLSKQKMRERERDSK
jgi:hypothetical protein